ncbi:hypothetical protein LTS08_005867 [Lithohypha guttulata]|uniref:uncharacterized protein n=1 Tax=Lithohypha guttulata TaxID=1690604 RepID=UPI002DDFD42A|nr:hypothetical protein LTR51_002380 [Lithohypha guttulata]KAK5099286.1 hypothetical protein LTS08_005867 [Lithohypha guttulata]
MSDASTPSTTSIKHHLAQQGWALIPSVLTKEQSATVLTHLWAAKTQSEARGDKVHLPHLDPNPSNVRVFYLLEHEKIFRDLIAHPTIIEYIKFVLGENFLISNFTANIARPGSQSMALHSDQSIVVPDPWKEVWAINAIWCLTDVHRDNGATLYIPGSNKYVYQSEVPRNANELLVPFEAKAGDVILMDGRVWHTSGSNITADEDRALLFGYYTAPFLRQQVNWTAKLPQDIQKDLSEEMKEWLGLGPNANTGRTGGISYNYLSKQYAAKV